MSIRMSPAAASPARWDLPVTAVEAGRSPAPPTTAASSDPTGSSPAPTPTRLGATRGAPTAAQRAAVEQLRIGQLAARGLSPTLLAQASPVDRAQRVASAAFDQAIRDMNANGHRMGNGVIAAGLGNIARNTGLNRRMWKCEDQAPFTADRIRSALRAQGITNAHVGLVRTPDLGHTFVVVNVGGTREPPSRSNGFDTNVVRGGTNVYFDPWTGAGASRTPPAAVGSVLYDRSLWEMETLGRDVR